MKCIYRTLCALALLTPTWALAQLQPSTLIFITSRSEMGRAIRGFSHVGIALDNDTIAEAHPFLGTRTCSLKEFLFSADLRQPVEFALPPEQYETQALQALSKFLNQPYDLLFNDRGYHCATFIDALFSNPFPQHPMTFEAEFWDTYFEKLGCTPPRGRLGLNPNTLWESNFWRKKWQRSVSSTPLLTTSHFPLQDHLPLSVIDYLRDAQCTLQC